MYALNGRILGPDAPFTDADGTQYPAGWARSASGQERELAGLIDVIYIDAPPPAASIAYSRQESFDGDHTVSAAYTRLPNEQIHPVIIAKVKAHRAALKAAGVVIEVAGQNKWIDSDDGARLQQLGLLQLGATNALPPNLQWKCLDGSFITMTHEIAQAIFLATASADMANFANAETHIAAIKASEKPELHDWSTGWVQCYAPAITD